MVQFDPAAVEERFTRDLHHPQAPETIFERQRAVTVVSQACNQVHDSMAREGRAEYFVHLQSFLLGGIERSYAAVAADVGMSEGAVKVAMHSIRRRYREILRANVSHTVADPAEVDDEIRYLFRASSMENGV